MINVLIDIKAVNSTEKECYKTITVKDQQVSFKLDTGAQVNVLPISLFQSFDLKLNLVLNDIASLSYGNHKPEGYIMLTCNTDKRSNAKLNNVVADASIKMFLRVQVNFLASRITLKWKMSNHHEEYLSPFIKS